MKEEWIQTISNRYIELYEKLIGEKFVPHKLCDDETEERIITFLQKLNF